MAYEKQNFEDGQVLKAEHLNKMEDAIASIPSFGVVGEGVTLKWDGNPNAPKTIISGGFYAECYALFYKVSDVVITAEDLANGAIVELWNEPSAYQGNGVKNCSFADGSIVQKADGAIWMSAEEVQGNVMSGFEVFCYPENSTYPPGIYFGADLGTPGARFHIASLTIPGCGKFPVIETMEPEFLPAPLQVDEADGFTNTIVWNGDTSELTNISETGWGMLSDVVVTAEDLANGFYAECSWGTPYPVVMRREDGIELDTSDPENIFIKTMDENGNPIPIVQFTPQGVFVGHNPSMYTDWQTGITQYYDHRLYTLTIPGFNRFRQTITKPIDKKCLPKAEWVDYCYNEFATKEEFNHLVRSLREAGYLAK